MILQQRNDDEKSAANNTRLADFSGLKTYSDN